MCILFVYKNDAPEKGGYRLIIASNRDEFYKRPASNATCLDDVIGGRDMEVGREGGMWIGLTVRTDASGGRFLKFGALLNVTGEDKRAGPVNGRGAIVGDYLKNTIHAPDYFDQLEMNGPYNAYNFVAIEMIKNNIIQAYHRSNSPNAIYKFGSEDKFLGFGNSTPENPLKKVRDGCVIFENIIKNHKLHDQLIKDLLVLLKNKERHLPDEELQRRSPVAYEYLSAIFVELQNANYGTRTHTIILVDYEWNVEFIEHTLNEPIDINNPKWNINIIKSNL